jgi:hypothetical protein
LTIFKAVSAQTFMVPQWGQIDFNEGI